MSYWKRLDLQEVYAGASLNVVSFEIQVDGEAITGIRASGSAGKEVRVELKERLPVESHQDVVNLGKRVQEKISSLNPNQTFTMDREGRTEIGLKTNLGGDGYGAPGGKTVNAATGEAIEEGEPDRFDIAARAKFGGEGADAFMSLNYNIQQESEKDENSNYSYSLQVGADS